MLNDKLMMSWFYPEQKTKVSKSTLKTFKVSVSRVNSFSKGFR